MTELTSNITRHDMTQLTEVPRTRDEIYHQSSTDGKWLFYNNFVKLFKNPIVHTRKKFFSNPEGLGQTYLLDFIHET